MLSIDRSELRTFLLAKRAAISPDQLGLPSSGQRRVKGLRREEVASIAGVGLTWYTWLEQGREIHVSREILQRVADALRLSPPDTAYLFSLAGKQAPEIIEHTPYVDETMQAIFDGCTTGLAYMFDDVFDVRAFNTLADKVYRFDPLEGPWPRNMAWRNFTDPYRQALYSPWPEYAAMMVGIFRARLAQRQGHLGLERLLKDLLEASADFRHFWEKSKETGPSPYTPIHIHLNVPGVGSLHLTSVRLVLASNPDWFVMFQHPLDCKTEAAIKKLYTGISRAPKRQGEWGTA